jgi:hypothetical protein
MTSNKPKLILDPTTGKAELVDFNPASIGAVSIEDFELIKQQISAINTRLDAIESAIENGGTTPLPPTLTKLTGTPFGTGDFFNNDPLNGFQSVFDGDVNTFFDSNTKDYAICGLDFGEIKRLRKIKFHPRINQVSRMHNGRFEYSADNVDYSLIYIVQNPASGWNEFDIDLSARWIRYVSPEAGYGNIAEIEVYH